MSYPEPRYLGEKGEINAVFRPADTGRAARLPASACTRTDHANAAAPR
ncbi:hypothetical protein RVN83_11385 [Streptomyces sp. PU10]|nr:MULTISPECIES: hypothetical protein [unclassified Streptomyces]MDU0253823.1 hypothetical protein [Streptomyces sp. PU10]WSU03774.1 hypothetical protein OG368_25575 [Streptomyces sp. NBC_01124]